MFLLPGLWLKENEPLKYAILERMVSHVEEHRKCDSWPLYKKHVVDFLRERCGMAGKFGEEEIFHLLGVLDVNSVKINTQRSGETRRCVGISCNIQRGEKSQGKLKIN